MAFDLPIDDVKVYIEDLLAQMGSSCTIDGVSTKIMISDLERAFNNIQENSKQAVISKDVAIVRGSKVNFTDGRKAICYTIPNDDIVSYSAKILMCNSTVDIYEYLEQYAPNGDVTDIQENIRATLDGFIERLTAKEKQFDVGLLHEAILRFTTYVDSDIKMDDIVFFKNEKYRVIDIDPIVEGLLIAQLASIRK